MDLEDLSQPSRVDLRALGPPKASATPRPSSAVARALDPRPLRHHRGDGAVRNTPTPNKNIKTRVFFRCATRTLRRRRSSCATSPRPRRLRTAQASHTPLATFLFSVCHSAHSPIRKRCDVSAERSASVNNADAVAVAGLRAGMHEVGARGTRPLHERQVLREAEAEALTNVQALKTGQAQAPREGHACEMVGMLSCVCSF